MLRMCGWGSSTTTVLVIDVQPAALQAWRVTSLDPEVEKVVVGLRAVEVPAWAPAVRSSSAKHEKRALRNAGRGRERG